MRKALISILFTIAAIAQALAVTADEAIAKAIAAINSAPAITARFTAAMPDGSSTGQMTLARERFAIVAGNYGVWYDGTDMCSYYSTTGEASLTTPTPEELMEANPFDIISHCKSNFKAAIISDKAGRCTLRLTPLSKKASVKTATITLDTRTWLPTRVNATFDNGSDMKIEISDAKVLKSAPAKSAFQFPKEKYPGVEIIDLR